MLLLNSIKNNQKTWFLMTYPISYRNDGKDAHAEVSQRDFQLVNILIKELAVMDQEDFKSGLSELEESIKMKLNKVMTEGQITDVYTVKKILQ